MIFIWVVALITLFGFGLVWYFVNYAIGIYIDTVYAIDPSLYGAEHTLIVNLWTWLGAIMLIALIMWVYVNSQKPELPYVYR